MKGQGGPEPSVEMVRGPDRGGQALGAGPENGMVSSRGTCLRRAPEEELPSRGSALCSLQPATESPRPCTAEGFGHCQADASPQYGVSYRCLLRQNQVLLTALEELQSRCASLKKENSLLRKSCFPETQEKVRHLKRKNAELAVIAKRLEERARKLQEANLKVVNAPVAVKGSCAGLCKKALVRQRATDLREQASALLAKDKQISSLQRQCQELQAKITSGKDGSPCLPPLDFRQLLRESQKEVLRLQRQIALKNFKASLGPCSQGLGNVAVALAVGLGPPAQARSAYWNGFSPSRGSLQREELSSVTEAVGKTGSGAFPLPQGQGGTESPINKGVTAAPEIKQQIQQLESELRKKRKQCENLEHEVRKKHKRYAELEIQLQDVRSDNVQLAEENALLHGQVEWTEKVESENADLRLQVAVVTEERDSALHKTQELQNRLESLGQALKHMRDVAERRQHLELEHGTALVALQKKQDEVRQLQQAQAEARREHEGAVQLLEDSLDCMQARVRELEDQCRSHTEQFHFLSQELRRFHLHTGKAAPVSSSCCPSSLVTSEVTFAACRTSPPLLDGFKEKDPEIVPVSPRCNRKVQDEEGEGFPSVALRLPYPVASAMARSPDASIPPVAYKKPLKKLESQSSSSRSESTQNSPKSCPTPEVDTASEMEELDIDSISLIPESEHHGPVKLRVFLARYSYNPFDGPNENPEAELPLTAGEYIYVYGEMDEDGFFEGELMDGRRGLVPSNFVERVLDDDLVTCLPPEPHDLSRSSPLERSFLSTSISSGERSDYSAEELSASTAPSRLEGDPGEGSVPTAVPYPRKVTLIKQFGGKLLVGWEPPLPPAGGSDIQSYNVYVDAELRQTIKAGGQMKAVLEKLDLKNKTYRVSVQSVSERGSSDRLWCTFLVGGDVALAPSQFKVRSITATSAEISWAPSNSNFLHTVYLNGQKRDVTKAGVYWYTFRGLHPNTSYMAAVEVQPQRTFWEPCPDSSEQLLSTEIHFTTASAGSPDAPLDVRVESGPMPGILVISWLPVTIDAEGSSNGVRVTGYAVYADGQKVMEVTSPTAGSVLAEVCQLRILQACQEVSVRTVSLYGESVDSVPAQIPLALLEDGGCPSPSQLSCLTSRLSYRDTRAVLATQTSPARGMELSSAANRFGAKFTSQPSNSNEKPVRSLHAETSPNGRASPASTPVPPATPPEVGTLPRKEGNAIEPPASGTVLKDPVTLRKVEHEEPGGDNQELLFAVRAQEAERPGGNGRDREATVTCSVDQGMKEPVPQRGVGSDPICLGAKLPPPSRPSVQGEGNSTESGQSERRSPESVSGSLGKVKLLKEISKDDSALLVPRARREQGEKRSDPGNRPLTLLADHSRGSDLSDIMEEEEEEEQEATIQRSGRQGEYKQDPGEHNGRENTEKDPGDSDSDEEILERILEIPLPKNCSKVLFSIPEVTEEEEAEDWEQAPKSRRVPSPPEKEAADGFLESPLHHPGRMEAPPPPPPLHAQPKRNPDLSEPFSPERGLPQRIGGEEAEEASSPGSWEGDCQGKGMMPAAEWRRPTRCKEKACDQALGSSKRKGDPRERSRPMLSSSAQAGGGLYRAQSLKEDLDVITSLAVGAELGLCHWARLGPGPASQRRTLPREAGGHTPQSSPCRLSPESLESDIDDDSEEEQAVTVTSTPASRLSSDGRAEGSSTDCEEGWSDCSSRSGSVRSSGQRELKRCSSWEEESTEWSGSPGHSPGHLCWRKGPPGPDEERSRSLERSPSLWRAVPNRPRKEASRSPSQTRVAGSSNPDLLNSTGWQAPTRRGRRPQRKHREVDAPPGANFGAWRSPSPKTMDGGDSARLFVALFDYDPTSMSPNPDAAEEELPFQEGQILKVYGHKDADGFYRGESGGRAGYIPCNMVSEVQVDGGSAKKQLLHEGRLSTTMLAETLGNGAFSPSPPLQRPAVCPPKPWRSKKAEREKTEDEKTAFGAHDRQDLSSEEETSRRMVAIFDYNPKENSPNLDTEAELQFCAGDVVTVLSSMDDDGFYYGEIHGRKGLVPSNFLEAAPSDGALPSEPSLRRQPMRKRRVQ